MPAYVLTEARGGARLTPSKPGSCVEVDRSQPITPLPPLASGETRLRSCGNNNMNGRVRLPYITWTANHIDSRVIAGALSNFFRRPVVDRTGLRYDQPLAKFVDSGEPSPESNATMRPMRSAIVTEISATPAESPIARDLPVVSPSTTPQRGARSTVAAMSAERDKIQFSVNRDTFKRLRRVQPLHHTLEETATDTSALERWLDIERIEFSVETCGAFLRFANVGHAHHSSRLLHGNEHRRRGRKSPQVLPRAGFVLVVIERCEEMRGKDPAVGRLPSVYEDTSDASCIGHRRRADHDAIVHLCHDGKG